MKLLGMADLPRRPPPPSLAVINPAITSLTLAQNKGFSYLDSAITCDEKGSYTQALDLYRLGIHVYKEALTQNVEFTSSNLPKNRYENETIAQIRFKITKNMVLAEERVKEVLQKLEESSKNKFQIYSKNIPKSVAKKNSISKIDKKPYWGINRPVEKTNISLNISRPLSASQITLSSNDNKHNNNTNNSSGSKYGSNYNSPYAANNVKNRSKSAPQNSLPVLDYTGLDKKLVIKILDELAILPKKNKISIENVAGNTMAKDALRETIILPSLRPEIFTGLRAPPKGILLFGPPGCGKTLLAKALASKTSFTFFNISASSLTSKWVGEAEKLVRTLFNIGRQLSPTIIFMDEIDSILTERKSSENESSRRLKTEFMLQFDGLSSNPEEKLLVLAATNRPYELDDAILRRFPKRIYIKLPDKEARLELITMLLNGQKHSMTSSDIHKLVNDTAGYSGSDLSQLAKEAAYEPIRKLGETAIATMQIDNVPDISYNHFKSAISRIRPSVSSNSLSLYQKWNMQFGDIS